MITHGVPALAGAAVDVLADYLRRGDVRMLGFGIAAITSSVPPCRKNLRLEPLLSQLSYEDEDDRQRRLFQ